MKKVFLVLLLSGLAMGCGGAKVKLINNTNNNFTKVTVQSTTDATVKVEFTDLKKSRSTDAESWDDSEKLTVKVVTESANTTDKTGSVVLTDGETNIITLRDGASSSELKYSVAVDAP